MDHYFNVLVLSLFSAFCVALGHMHDQLEVVAYQCPGALISKEVHIKKLKKLGYLEVDISQCQVKNITNEQFFTIRQLQKEVFNR